MSRAVIALAAVLCFAAFGRALTGCSLHNDCGSGNGMGADMGDAGIDAAEEDPPLVCFSPRPACQTTTDCAAWAASCCAAPAGGLCTAIGDTSVCYCNDASACLAPQTCAAAGDNCCTAGSSGKCNAALACEPVGAPGCMLFPTSDATLCTDSSHTSACADMQPYCYPSGGYGPMPKAGCVASTWGATCGVDRAVWCCAP